MGIGALLAGLTDGAKALNTSDFDDPDDIYAALKAGPKYVMRLGGGAINIVFAKSAPGLDRGKMTAWIRRAAEAMIAYFGRFPIADMGLLIVAQPGSRVGHATTYGYQGPATLVHVGVDADEAALASDWVLVHEMLHCALPNLPRNALWLQEGNATYIEPIIRARVGQISVDEVWRQSIIGMPSGQPQPGEAGMDGTTRHDRLYWGGALFWLCAEINIHDKSLGRRTLRDAMRAFSRESGGNNVEWTPERLMAVGDAATGTDALSRLYDRFAYHSPTVDLDRLFRRLGVALIGNHIVFDNSAPLAHFRTTLTKGIL